MSSMSQHPLEEGASAEDETQLADDSSSNPEADEQHKQEEEQGQEGNEAPDQEQGQD
jgi:hypothetical protein